MSEHTKGKLEKTYDRQADQHLIFAELGGEAGSKICHIAAVLPDIISIGGRTEFEANAERFVKCWNCHDKLVATCEFVFSRLKSGRKKNKLGCSFPFLTADEICTELETALDEVNRKDE